ncbi:MAG TPA: hypothetical protein VFF15_05420 [Flavobacteriaceae bacterium]|nr:hypothetical protein [Flavobacteriaceae bacterium]
MIKKELLIGICVGLIANLTGLILAAILLGNSMDFMNTLEAAKANDFLTKLISLGAILNLVAFFVFIKKKQDYRARGVLLVTVFIAVFTFVFKFI